jgi:glycerophosphoryl diester phosphodiesterase
MIFEAKPTIVGHRGFGAGAPGGYAENTLESYLAAVAHGLSWVELDVQRSVDGQLVIRHDPFTPDGELIVTRAADELAASGILRLVDVLAALPPGVAVNIDVKTVIEDALDPAHRRTAALVAEALRRHAGQRRLFVSSFDPSLLMHLKERKDTLPSVPLGLITWLNFPVWHAIPAAANLGLDAICLHTGTLGLRRPEPRRTAITLEKVIAMAHQAGLEVLVWSPTPEMAAELARAGADALSVDDIPGVLAALAAEGLQSLPVTAPGARHAFPWRWGAFPWRPGASRQRGAFPGK